MAAEYDVVDVFVGTFASKKVLDQYLEETHDDSDAPVSAFARDQGQSFCDQDFLEATYRKAARDFSGLCSGLSFAEYWFEDARSAYIVGSINRANTVLLAFGEAVEQPRSVSGKGFELYHLGRFRRSTPAVGSDVLEDGTPVVCYLEITEAAALVNDRPVKLVAIDSAGAVIGQGGSSDGPLYIDLPEPREAIAPRQLALYPNPCGQWVIEDLAGGDATVYRGQPLNHSRVMPWHDQTLEVGGVRMRWLASKP